MDQLYGVRTPIPIKDDGTYDIEIQKEIAKKYEKVEHIKTEISKQINSVLNIQLDV